MEINEKIELWIDSYVKLYEMILQKVNQKWPENSLRITDKIFQEMAKDIREGWISFPSLEEQKEENKGNKEDEPATKKQRNALHKFGIENIPESLTKKEAHEILEELIDLSRHGNMELLKEKIEEINKEWK